MKFIKKDLWIYLISLGLFMSVHSQVQATQKTQSADQTASSELKVGEEVQEQVGGKVQRYKRVPTVTDERPSKAVIDVFQKAEPIMEQARNAPKRQSILVYNADFARQFHLDPAQAVDLGKGLWAMELVLVKDSGHRGPATPYSRRASVIQAKIAPFGAAGPYDVDMINRFTSLFDQHSLTVAMIVAHKQQLPYHFKCYLNLYLASELPIAYPFASKLLDTAFVAHPYLNSPLDMQKRALASVEMRANEKGFKRPCNRQDYNATNKDWRENNKRDKVFLSAHVHKRFGFIKPELHGSDIHRYKKHLIPGLHYLSIGPMFTDDWHQIKQHGYVLLKKQSAADKRSIQEYAEADFVHFLIPPKILAWPPLRLAIQREESTVLFDRKNNVSYMNFY